jgi:hypothetical protein
VCIGRHGCRYYRFFYHARGHFIQFCEPRAGRARSCLPAAMVVPSQVDSL